MQRILVVALSFLSLSCALSAQSIPDSELIARLKANRSLFSSFDHGPSLKDRANQLNQDVSRDLNVSASPGICVGCPKPDPNDDPDIKRATNHSDIVVVAHDFKNVSALTQNETFVFTDSELIVDQIWKNASSSEAGPSIAEGSEITVVEPGGAVRINGHLIRGSLSDRVPFKIGHTYLLYLKYLPDSRSYIPIPFAGFDISSLAVVPLKTDELLPAPNLLSNKPAFVQALHSSTLHAVEEDQ